MLKHYVEISYWKDGTAWDEIQEVSERKEEKVVISENAFRYRFFSRIEVIAQGERLTGRPRDISPYTYFGKEYSLKELKEHFPELEILALYMEQNSDVRAVQTCSGRWFTMEKEGKLIPREIPKKFEHEK